MLLPMYVLAIGFERLNETQLIVVSRISEKCKLWEVGFCVIRLDKFPMPWLLRGNAVVLTRLRRKRGSRVAAPLPLFDVANGRSSTCRSETISGQLLVSVILLGPHPVLTFLTLSPAEQELRCMLGSPLHVPFQRMTTIYQHHAHRSIHRKLQDCFGGKPRHLEVTLCRVASFEAPTDMLLRPFV